MTPEELRRNLTRGTRSESLRDEAERRAHAMAKELKDDIHVYMHRGWYSMCQGPDLDHPKTAATFVVPFKRKGV